MKKRQNGRRGGSRWNELSIQRKVMRKYKKKFLVHESAMLGPSHEGQAPIELALKSTQVGAAGC
jgi:hypothetical protein